MSKTLILHIGTHKTGTSSIQYSLLRNSNLLQKNSIRYVPLHRYRNILKDLAQEQIDLKKFQKFACDPLSALLLSAERLSGNLATYNDNLFQELINLKKISEHFDFKLKVMCYLRKQDSYLESAYMQHLKWGYKDTFSKFLEAKENSQDWLMFYESLRSIFDENNLVVKPFEKKFLYQNDVVADFWKELGIDLKNEILCRSPEKNQGYGFSGIELTRRLNKYTTKPQKEALRKHLETIIKHQDRLETLFNREEHDRLINRYQQSNQKLSTLLRVSEQAFELLPKTTYFHTHSYSSVFEKEFYWKLLSELYFAPDIKVPIFDRIQKPYKYRHFLANKLILKLELLRVLNK